MKGKSACSRIATRDAPPALAPPQDRHSRNSSLLRIQLTYLFRCFLQEPLMRRRGVSSSSPVLRCVRDPTPEAQRSLSGSSHGKSAVMCGDVPSSSSSLEILCLRVSSRHPLVGCLAFCFSFELSAQHCHVISPVISS